MLFCVAFLVSVNSPLHISKMSQFLDTEAQADNDYIDLFASSEDDDSNSIQDFLDDSDDIHEEEDEENDHRRCINQQRILDDDSDDEDEVEENEVLVPTTTPTPQPSERPSLTNQQKRVLKNRQAPGYDQYPQTDWSLTVTKNGTDIERNYIDIILAFFETYCIKGGVSTEVGKRAHNLHLQGVFRCLFPNDSKVLGAFLKSHMPNNGVGHRVLAKQLVRGQDFVTMCGYILKDEGQPWFQHRSHNIPREDLQTGRLQHITALTAIDENRVILTPRNLMSEMYKFTMRCLFPCIPPARFCVLYMMQSGNYIPSPEWLKRYSKMDSNEAQSMWDIVFAAKRTTIEQTDRIFFDGQCRRIRYFLANNRRGVEAESPQLRPHGSPSTDSEGMSPYDRIRDVLDSAPTRERRPGIPMEGDVVPLPVNTDFEDGWYIDRQPGSPDEGEFDILNCPPTLDAMLQIVKNKRENRLDILQSAQDLTADTYVRSRESRGGGSTFPSVDMSRLPARR
jgi:hypothetical protein